MKTLLLFTLLLTSLNFAEAAKKPAKTTTCPAALEELMVPLQAGEEFSLPPWNQYFTFIIDRLWTPDLERVAANIKSLLKGAELMQFVAGKRGDTWYVLKEEQDGRNRVSSLVVLSGNPPTSVKKEFRFSEPVARIGFCPEEQWLVVGTYQRKISILDFRDLLRSRAKIADVPPGLEIMQKEGSYDGTTHRVHFVGFLPFEDEMGEQYRIVGSAGRYLKVFSFKPNFIGHPSVRPLIQMSPRHHDSAVENLEGVTAHGNNRYLAFWHDDGEKKPFNLMEMESRGSSFVRYAGAGGGGRTSHLAKRADGPSTYAEFEALDANPED